MRKIYVLDTSVLVYDVMSYKQFKNSDIVIPVIVLDELDKLKKGPGEVAKNARLFIRELDVISSQGEIHNGIVLENDILFKVDTTAQRAIGSDSEYGDNQILATAAALMKPKGKSKKQTSCTLVSRDINLRIRARSYGMEAENYDKEKVDTEEMYRGYRIVVDETAGINLAHNGSIDNGAHGIDLSPHECISILDASGVGIAVGRRMGSKIKSIQAQSPWGIQSRNVEQAFAINLLSDPKVPLVSLVGIAGSGKSLLAVASALEMTIERKKYNKIMVYKSFQPVGKDIGYLPGLLSEKVSPWMGSITDAMEVCFGQKSKERWKIAYDMYCEKGLIEFAAMTYIRGRSIPNTFIIIDEAQNLSREEMKTILTRAGEGSKIVLTGDVSQIDTPHLDASNNGLSYAIEKFRSSELSGHVTFEHGERSALATEAAEIL